MLLLTGWHLGCLQVLQAVEKIRSLAILQTGFGKHLKADLDFLHSGAHMPLIGTGPFRFNAEQC